MKRNFVSRKTGTVIIIFCTAVFLMSTNPAGATEKGIENLKKTGTAFASIAKKVSPSVVNIKIEKKMENYPGQINPYGGDDDGILRFFFGPQGPRVVPPRGRQHPQLQPEKKWRTIGGGSGFIISPEGHILTNNHVVRDADKLLVKLEDGNEYEAEIIGTDPQSDVAVIKIDAQKGLPVVEFGDSEKLQPGEWVLAIGNPFGLTHTITAGIVSAKGRSGVGLADYENFIQTDAAINPGNSGGPLVNLDGKVVGMNTAIFSRSGGYMGIGFAIPINMAKSIKDQLIKSGSVNRGQLGIIIQNLTPELAAMFDIKDKTGIVVSQVIKDSPAEKNGLKSGDVITKLNEKPVKDINSFRNKIAMTSPGTEISLTVLRKSKERTINMKVGSQNDTAFFSGGNQIFDRLGLYVQDLTVELAERFGYTDREGVLITEIKPGTPAAEAGLKPGMLILGVNQKRVANIKEFKNVLRQNKSDKVLLLVKNDKFSTFIVLKLKDKK